MEGVEMGEVEIIIYSTYNIDPLKYIMFDWERE